MRGRVLVAGLLLATLLPAAGSQDSAQAAAADKADKAHKPTPEPATKVDPDTLVVPSPDTPEPREPTLDVNKLLRAELSMLEALEELEHSISRRTTELERLRAQEAVVERDLGEMASRFEALTDAIDTHRGLIHRRLRAMIQLKRTEPYQVLFASEAYATFMRRVRALDELLAADRRRVDRYRQELAAWRDARDDLERRRENLVRTRKTIEIMVQELTWDKEEKQALLDSVRERAAFHAKLGHEMNSVDEELKTKVAAFADPDRPRLWMQESKGRLSMPIRNGRISGGFGIRTHPKFGTRTVHRGIDVVPGEKWDGKSDVPVRAIYWGYVAYVGRLRGLGNTVILDHTRGYMSLYAHLDEARVKLGEKVKTGQTLATMGDSGSLTGAFLYLELRYEGRAEDPRPWLK